MGYLSALTPPKRSPREPNRLGEPAAEGEEDDRESDHREDEATFERPAPTQSVRERSRDAQPRSTADYEFGLRHRLSAVAAPRGANFLLAPAWHGETPTASAWSSLARRREGSAGASGTDFAGVIVRLATMDLPARG